MSSNDDLSRDLIVELTRKLDKLCITMESVRDKQDEMIENVSKIKEAVYNPDEGLYARIRALESWKDTSSKVIWTLFTAVIGLSSAVVIKLLKRKEMKVKVSYTVDFENIPEVVRDIVKKAEKIQDEMAEVSAKLHAGDLGVASLKSIGDLRQMSSDLVESYSDCQSILSGFLSAAFTPSEEDKGGGDADSQGD